MVRLEPVVLSIPFDDTEQTVLLVRAVTADDVAYGEALLAEPELFLVALDFFTDAVANTDPRDFNLTWQRLMALLEEYTPDPLEEYMKVKRPPRLTLFYGERCRSDAVNARRLEGLPTVKLVPVPVGLHNCATYLKRRNELTEAVRRELYDVEEEQRAYAG